ncbi:GSCOCG00000713001-RA-CDS [Cotesia congregata]|nr:GSCOCG00000713001-RA-CDS [Cotesia congregata]
MIIISQPSRFKARARFLATANRNISSLSSNLGSSPCASTQRASMDVSSLENNTSSLSKSGIASVNSVDQKLKI